MCFHHRCIIAATLKWWWSLRTHIFSSLKVSTQIYCTKKKHFQPYVPLNKCYISLETYISKSLLQKKCKTAHKAATQSKQLCCYFLGSHLLLFRPFFILYASNFMVIKIQVELALCLRYPSIGKGEVLARSSDWRFVLLCHEVLERHLAVADLQLKRKSKGTTSSVAAWSCRASFRRVTVKLPAAAVCDTRTILLLINE